MNMYIKLFSLFSFAIILTASVYTFVNGGIADTNTASDAYFDAALRAKPIALSLATLEANNCIPGRTYTVSGYITQIQTSQQIEKGKILYTLADAFQGGHIFSLLSGTTYVHGQQVALNALCIAKIDQSSKSYTYYLFE